MHGFGVNSWVSRDYFLGDVIVFVPLYVTARFYKLHNQRVSNFKIEPCKQSLNGADQVYRISYLAC